MNDSETEEDSIITGSSPWCSNPGRTPGGITGYNEVKGQLPVSYINVLYHMQGEKWHCHISDWVQEVLGFILFCYFFYLV